MRRKQQHDAPRLGALAERFDDLEQKLDDLDWKLRELDPGSESLEERLDNFERRLGDIEWALINLVDELRLARAPRGVANGAKRAAKERRP